MVRKNIKFDKVENVTVIHLGKGSVKVAAFSSEGNYTGIGFINSEVHPIGTTHDDKGKRLNETGVDAVLVFDKIESIEVLELHLKKAKEDLIAMKSKSYQ